MLGQVQRGTFQPSTVWVCLFFSTILAESCKFYKCQDLLVLIFNLGSIQGLCTLHLYSILNIYVMMGSYGNESFK